MKKKILLGAAGAGGAAFALHRLARRMHDHCRGMMQDHCGETVAERGCDRAPTPE